jgi:D-ornithine 4,5-aminomutase subunit beta
MKRLHEYAIEKGVREKLIICAGGTQVSAGLAVKNGMDQGFEKTDRGQAVASFFVKRREEKEA